MIVKRLLDQGLELLLGRLNQLLNHEIFFKRYLLHSGKFKEMFLFVILFVHLIRKYPVHFCIRCL